MVQVFPEYLLFRAQGFFNKRVLPRKCTSQKSEKQSDFSQLLQSDLQCLVNISISTTYLGPHNSEFSYSDSNADL